MKSEKKELRGLDRREFIQTATTIFLLFVSTKSYAADKFPTHEISYIIPFRAGGGADRTARLLKPYLDKHFGVPLVIQTLPGASGAIGWTEFVNSEPDGYTTCLVTWPILYQTIRFKKPRYKSSDFVNIGGINDDPMLFIRHKDSKHKWNTFKDFVEACKAEPNKYRLCMTGPASPHNLAAYAAMDAFDIKFVVVNVAGGSGEAMSMLAGQHVDAMVSPALACYGLRDSAICFGVFSDREVPNMWPEGKPISETMGIKLPNISIPRGFATHAKVKEQYPARYQWLVEKFKAAATEPSLIAEVKKKGMSDVMFWYPPEKLRERAQTLMDLVDKYAFLFEAKKK